MREGDRRGLGQGRGCSTFVCVSVEASHLLSHLTVAYTTSYRMKAKGPVLHSNNVTGFSYFRVSVKNRFKMLTFCSLLFVVTCIRPEWNGVNILAFVNVAERDEQ